MPLSILEFHHWGATLDKVGREHPNKYPRNPVDGQEKQDGQEVFDGQVLPSSSNTTDKIFSATF